MYLQLCTEAALDKSPIGKAGVPHARHAGLCLECEGYTDGANSPEIGRILLRPGTPKRQTTAYAFGLRPN
jgi:aldose 1-epimerase